MFSGNNPRGSQLRKQAEKHLIGRLHLRKTRPAQLAPVTEHVVIPAKDKIGKPPVAQLQNIRFHQPLSGKLAPYAAIVVKQLMK